MEIFWFYQSLGFWHVMDWNGLDHLYFIITLAMPFGFKEGRKLLFWVTLFTLGHTLSLIGNFYLDFSFSSYWIELLIPITIAISAALLLVPEKYNQVSKEQLFFPVVTLIFGVIHGLGFGRYFNMLIPQDAVGLSLFSFALGVEFAQTAIVIGVLCVSFLFLKVPRMTKTIWKFIIGSIIFILALGMIFDRI
jgi:hypothetical protein